jgi:hypothetical protein
MPALSFYSRQRRVLRGVAPRHAAGLRLRGEGLPYVTHFLELRSVQRPLANFFASRVLVLREKLGPFLWQLPR